MGRRRSARPRWRDTRGKPNPNWVWVSPAPERERKRENIVGERTKQQKKERGDTNIKANEGQILKGTKPNSISTPKTMKPTPVTIQRPRKHQTTNKHQANRVSGELSPQGGGAHGPPCPLGESPQGTAVPRGPKTPPLREPPLEAQKQSTCPTQSKDPKRWGPALSRSSWP